MDRQAPDARTPAHSGPACRGCVSPPGGVRTRSDPPRWCSAYCRSLHITSFRCAGHVTRWRRWTQATESSSGRAGRIRAGPVRGGRGASAGSLGGRRADPAAAAEPLGTRERLRSRTLRARSSCGSWPSARSSGCSITTVGRDADAVDPGLVRRQPLGDREPEAAGVVRQQDPLLDGALAVGLGADAPWRGRVSWSAPVRISEALAVPPLTSTTTAMPGSVATPSPLASCGVSLPVGVLLPVDRAGRDELVGDRLRRVHEAAGVVAQVDHEAPNARGEAVAEHLLDVVRGAGAEAR